MKIDKWIKNKYKNEFNDYPDESLSELPVKEIADLDDLITYLDWNYRNCNGDYSTDHTLACEFINYRNSQNRSNIQKAQYWLNIILSKLFCKHKDLIFVENLYGDKINYYSGREICRSLWECYDCGKIIKKGYLHK